MEGDFIRHRLLMWAASENGKKKKKTDECRARERERESDYRCLTHSGPAPRGLWMHSEWSGEASKVGHTARSLAKGRHRRNADTQVWDSGCRRSPQQLCYRINYWLLTGGVRLHRASRDGGRSKPTAEGSHIPNTHCTHVRSRSLLPRMDLHLHSCYFLFSNKLHTALLTSSNQQRLCCLTSATHRMSRWGNSTVVKASLHTSAEVFSWLLLHYNVEKYTRGL